MHVKWEPFSSKRLQTQDIRNIKTDCLLSGWRRSLEIGCRFFICMFNGPFFIWHPSFRDITQIGGQVFPEGSFLIFGPSLLIHGWLWDHSFHTFYLTAALLPIQAELRAANTAWNQPTKGFRCFFLLFSGSRPQREVPHTSHTLISPSLLLPGTSSSVFMSVRTNNCNI